jgi:hypothetical protein
MTKWPPDARAWGEILVDLPTDSHATVRAAVEAAVEEYFGADDCADESPTESDVWQALAKQADSKAMRSFCANIAKLQAYASNPEAVLLLFLASELGKVAAKAEARAVLSRPRSRKARLYVALMRAWTNAGRDLGQSEEGPLSRFLCRIANAVPFRLSSSGAKRAIGREQERRRALTILTGEVELVGQAAMLIDETKIYLIDQFGNRKS